MHGSLGVQQPGSHPDKAPHDVWGGLGHHQDLAGRVQPVQLQVRACKQVQQPSERGYQQCAAGWLETNKACCEQAHNNRKR